MYQQFVIFILFLCFLFGFVAKISADDKTMEANIDKAAIILENYYKEFDQKSIAENNRHCTQEIVSKNQLLSGYYLEYLK